MPGYLPAKEGYIERGYPAYPIVVNSENGAAFPFEISSVGSKELFA